MKQSEYFGTGCIEYLKEILKNINSKNVFVVTGKNSYQFSGAKEILTEILKNHSVTFFSSASPAPVIEEIIKGMDLFIESECDTVIAAGGGSVIDTAKSVNILSFQESNPVSIISGKNKIINKGKPLIAIPTTSGSGSEATHFSVVYMSNEKYSVAHEYILPDYSITDPQFTFNLPHGITATSGIDAFSQAVESFWNVNADEESKKYSEEAIRLILGNLKMAVNQPTEDSRVNMSRAAHLAGKAINITKTTAPHAVSYAMTTYFGIPHGQAVCITMPEFLEFNFNVTEKDIAPGYDIQEAKTRNKDLLKIFGCNNITEGRQMIIDLIHGIGLRSKLSDLKIISTEDLNLISRNVNLERLKNNPRIVTQKDLDTILNKII